MTGSAIFVLKSPFNLEISPISAHKSDSLIFLVLFTSFILALLTDYCFCYHNLQDTEPYTIVEDHSEKNCYSSIVVR